MKYKLELIFENKPECPMCILSFGKNNFKGETHLYCAGLPNRPKCREEGHRQDCPLEESEE